MWLLKIGSLGSIVSMVKFVAFGRNPYDSPKTLCSDELRSLILDKINL